MSMCNSFCLRLICVLCESIYSFKVTTHRHSEVVYPHLPKWVFVQSNIRPKFHHAFTVYNYSLAVKAFAFDPHSIILHITDSSSLRQFRERAMHRSETLVLKCGSKFTSIFNILLINMFYKTIIAIYIYIFIVLEMLANIFIYRL